MVYNGLQSDIVGMQKALEILVYARIQTWKLVEDTLQYQSYKKRVVSDIYGVFLRSVQACFCRNGER